MCRHLLKMELQCLQSLQEPIINVQNKNLSPDITVNPLWMTKLKFLFDEVDLKYHAHGFIFMCVIECTIVDLDKGLSPVSLQATI